MRIGKVAKSAGVNVETVRFYERRKLIQQPLKPQNGGIRSYPPETVTAIRFIRRAQELGFSLREVEELLSLQTNPACDCGDVRARASTKRREVEDKINQLITIRNALDQVIAACPGSGSTKTCSILNEMENPIISKTQ